MFLARAPAFRARADVKIFLLRYNRAFTVATAGPVVRPAPEQRRFRNNENGFATALSIDRSIERSRVVKSARDANLAVDRSHCVLII